MLHTNIANGTNRAEWSMSDETPLGETRMHTQICNDKQTLEVSCDA